MFLNWLPRLRAFKVQSALNMRLPLAFTRVLCCCKPSHQIYKNKYAGTEVARHFCAETWHLDLVCRVVLHLLPVTQGSPQHVYGSGTFGVARKVLSTMSARSRGPEGCKPGDAPPRRTPRVIQMDVHVYHACYIVLCCVVSYCVVLSCVVLYCIVSYRIVLSCVVLYCIVLCCVLGGAPPTRPRQKTPCDGGHDIIIIITWVCVYVCIYIYI